MAMDIFCSSLKNALLQWHLLAVEIPTLESAIRVINMFTMQTTRVSVRSVDEPDEDSPIVVMASPTSKPGLMATLRHFKEHVQQMDKNIEKLQKGGLDC